MSTREENTVVRLVRAAIARERRRRHEENGPAPRVEGRVSALVTVENDLSYLPDTLTAVLSQKTLPAQIIVLHADTSNDGSIGYVIPFDAEGLQVRVDVREEPRCASFGAQISYALGHGRVPASCELLWLLHDDSRPADDEVLRRLVEAYRKAPRASIVGAKQLDWDEDRLQDVGWFLDRHGRRASLVLDGEEDQSQYDGRQDVLAVSLAGALVGKEAWRHAGGTDAWMGTFGESTDLCRRVWRQGRRVIVVPQAAIRHVRARYRGIRSADGSHRRGRPHPTTMPILRAQEKIALTNTHGLMLLPAFLWSVLRALALFVVELFRKRPDRAFASLSIPGLRLGYLPRRLAPSRSYSRTGISARRYPSLVATRAQIRDWRLRRKAFAAQDGGEPLNPLAAAHLHRLARGRALDCLLLFVMGLAVMLAVSAPFLQVLFSGGSLVSSRLAPTTATASQTFETGTLMWTRGIGIGAPGVPLPFDLVLGLLALIGGGRLAVGITVFWLLALPCSMLSMYAAAGTVTRSRVLRIVSSLVWGVAAFVLGAVQDAALPVLVVFCLLPLAFYFIFRAVGWYAVDEPHSPHPSVQAAAVAGLLLAVVSAAEPQLILPLMLSFLLYLFVVKNHKAMLLLMPVPSIVVLAPTFYHVLLHTAQGAWRQLFSDALVGGDRSDPLALIRRDLGLGALPASSGRVMTIFLLVVASLLVIAAVCALFVRSARRMSRMAWILVVSGAVLFVIAPRVAVAPAAHAGSAPVTASCVPSIVIMLLGLLLAACALTGMTDSLFRVVALDTGGTASGASDASGPTVVPAPGTPATDEAGKPVAIGPATDGSGPHAGPHTITARRAPLAGLRSGLCVVLLIGTALAGILSGIAWRSSASVGASSQALPIVAASDLGDQASRILAVRADGQDSVRYWVMGTGSGDLIDVSPMASTTLLDHADGTEGKIASAAATLLSGGGEVADSLARLGFIGIYVPPVSTAVGQQPRQARSSLVSYILASDGTVLVTNTARDGLYVRLQEAGGICRSAASGAAPARSQEGSSRASAAVDPSACPVLARTQTALAAARTDPQRIVWLVLLVLVLLVYLIVAIPRSRHLSAEGGR